MLNGRHEQLLPTNKKRVYTNLFWKKPEALVLTNTFICFSKDRIKRLTPGTEVARCICGHRKGCHVHLGKGQEAGYSSITKKFSRRHEQNIASLSLFCFFWSFSFVFSTEFAFYCSLLKTIHSVPSIIFFFNFLCLFLKCWWSLFFRSSLLALYMSCVHHAVLTTVVDSDSGSFSGFSNLYF